MILQLKAGWRMRRVDREHFDFMAQMIALDQIASATSGDDIVPIGASALGSRHDMVECQIMGGKPGIAILACKTVAQKYVKPRECRLFAGGDIFLERDHAGNAHAETRGMDFALIFVDHLDTAQKHRLDGVLPRPYRQREIG